MTLCRPSSMGWSLLQFLVGGVVSVINIMIHALLTVSAISIARSAGLRHASGRDSV